MSTFIYGLPPSVMDSALFSSADVNHLVGGNTGNLAFCHSLRRHLNGDVPTLNWMVPAADINRMGGTGVLTLANQLGPHANMAGFAKRIEELSCKLVGVGLGAQAGMGAKTVDIPEGSLAWVRAIQNHSPTDAPNLALRGEFTQSALAAHGLAEKTVVTGCPTLFINGEKNLGELIASRWTGAPQRIAVTAGHPGWRHLAALEQSLVRLLEGSGGGDYICQSPDSMVALGRGHNTGLSAEALETCRAYIQPGMDGEAFQRWALQHAVSFFSASAWMEHLRRFDFVIGTRIHGVMLALQIGVPALCIAHDSRTEELCTTMAIPMVRAREVFGGVQRDQLVDLFQFDALTFDANRRMLAKRYAEFMRSNLLALAPYVQTLAAD